MADASAVILDAFRLRSDAKIVRWPDRYMDARGREFSGPDRYMDARGREFWGRVVALLPPECCLDLERIMRWNECAAVDRVNRCLTLPAAL